ncbi:MAG: hypothetical protein HC810_06495 [Acaryochloridaceae cyanobacterium RL_2_7]|nr:hypothetical protein [Acaryochloridaceae cyanobacterium RL_2_7]
MAPLPLTERIASIKAGLIGAIAAGCAAILLDLLNSWIHHQVWGNSFILAQSAFESALTLAFAVISGFLFGVTYRYILRQDSNPHLRTGAIAAFGLIRGLGQIDAGVLLHGHPAAMALLAGESMMMIAIAASCLDVAIHQKWIQRSF